MRRRWIVRRARAVGFRTLRYLVETEPITLPGDHPDDPTFREITVNDQNGEFVGLNVRQARRLAAFLNRDAPGGRPLRARRSH